MSAGSCDCFGSAQCKSWTISRFTLLWRWKRQGLHIKRSTFWVTQITTRKKTFCPTFFFSVIKLWNLKKQKFRRCRIIREVLIKSCRTSLTCQLHTKYWNPYPRIRSSRWCKSFFSRCSRLDSLRATDKLQLDEFKETSSPLLFNFRPTAKIAGKWNDQS